MLDLLLINPGERAQIYQQLGSELTAIEPPLWCRLIAGYARDRGLTVAILDAEVEHLTAAQVADDIRRRRPLLVGLVVYGHQPSASTQQMVGAGCSNKPSRCRRLRGSGGASWGSATAA